MSHARNWRPRVRGLMLAMVLTLAATAALADDTRATEQYGNSYPIVEKDALEEIQERMAQVAWDKVLDPDKMKEKVMGFQPEDAQRLPRAKEDKTRLVDIIYTLEFDIPDANGEVLYPRGYTFNVLDFTFLPNILVVFDGADPEQVTWLKNSPYADDFRTILIASGGRYFDLATDLSRPVYYLPQMLAERLQIQAAPSVLVQKGNKMQIREVDVTRHEDKAAKEQ